MEPLVESSKVSRKNKDPTGTKVKRSKKRTSEDDVTNQEALEQKVPSINNDIDNNRNTFNANNELYFSKKTKYNVKFNRKNVQGTKEYTHVNNLPENIIKTEEPEESLTLEFQNAVDDLVEADNASRHGRNVNNPKTNVIQNEVKDNFTNINNKECDTQNLTNSYEFDIPMIEVKATVPIQTLKDGIRDSISINKITTSPTSEKKLKAQMSIDGEVNTDVKELSIIKDKGNSNHISDTIESDKEFKVENIDDDMPEDNNADNINAIKIEDSGEVSNVPEGKSEESDDLESKVLELEKKMLNRFKGSLFDSIF